MKLLTFAVSPVQPLMTHEDTLHLYAKSGSQKKYIFMVTSDHSRNRKETSYHMDMQKAVTICLSE